MKLENLMYHFLIEEMKKPLGRIFLFSPTANLVDILEVKLKEEYDNGGASKYYIVKCLMQHWVESTSYYSKGGDTTKEFEATYLVSKDKFDEFVNENRTITWL